MRVGWLTHQPASDAKQQQCSTSLTPRLIAARTREMRGVVWGCFALVLAAFLAVASIRKRPVASSSSCAFSRGGPAAAVRTAGLPRGGPRRLSEQLASERRQHGDELASARDHIIDINRRLAAVKHLGVVPDGSPTRGAAAMRSLQEVPDASDPSPRSDRHFCRRYQLGVVLEQRLRQLETRRRGVPRQPSARRATRRVSKPMHLQSLL